MYGRAYTAHGQDSRQSSVGFSRSIVLAEANVKWVNPVVCPLVPKRNLLMFHHGTANGVGKKKTQVAGRVVFKHQVWECSVFQFHWTRLRRKLGLPKVTSLSDLICAWDFQVTGRE